MNALIINCSPVKNGATAEIVSIVESKLAFCYQVKSICIDDYSFAFCKGCRACHHTAECVLPEDDVLAIMEEYEWADVIVCVSPSYWADIPGQFKAFIDRCTPWCNTHEPHATISGGKRGYSIALRTGPGMKECSRIIESIEHFHGHLEIESCGSLGLCSVECKEDVLNRKSEIEEFCRNVIMKVNLEALEKWHFGMTEEMANELLELVKAGKKTATSGSLWAYEAEGEELPKVGETSIITDWEGTPGCVVRTTNVRVIPYCEMTYEIAKLEGEDDTLASWQRKHTAFFTEEGKKAGYVFSEDMPIVFEEFEVLEIF